MTKLIWMSDLHFASDGDVLGHDPRARLRAAIAFINQHHADAAACVISGDLVNRGSARDYAALAELLATLDLPVLPLVGNHDDRALLRTDLPLPPDAMPDFVQYRVDVPWGRLLCLDTLLPGQDAGAFCNARADWLQAQIADAGDRPLYLFLHHPPMPLGLPMQDTDRMQDGDAFLDLIAGQPAVRHLFIGHVHRPITGTVRGIPYATMRSVLYQAPAPRPAWDWDSFAPAAEAPDLGVLTLTDGDVTLQYTQICPASVGTGFALGQ